MTTNSKVTTAVSVIAVSVILATVGFQYARVKGYQQKEVEVLQQSNADYKVGRKKIDEATSTPRTVVTARERLQQRMEDRKNTTK
jgi:hypothetical protein